MSDKIMKKSFKDYYSDPEFRTKHLAYMNEKKECQCGRVVSRANMASHLRSKLHEKRLKEKESTIDSQVKKLAEQMVIEIMKQKKQI